MTDPRPDQPFEPAQLAAGFVLRVDAQAAICPLRGLIKPASALLWISSAQACWFPERGIAALGAKLGAADPLGGRKPAAIELLLLDSPAAVSQHPRAAEAKLTLDRTASVLVPGLVNAHTHLDLTHIGPVGREPGTGFLEFVEVVRSQRLGDPRQIARSVTLGALLACKAGTVAVGDIAGADATGSSLVPWQVLCASPLAGISFAEFFGLSDAAAAALPKKLAGLTAAEQQARHGRVRIGLQPHAPYSVGAAGYAMAFARQLRGTPVCTHLAETPEEREFIARGTGPFADLLAKLQLADAISPDRFGRASTPVATVLRDWRTAQTRATSDRDATTAADGPLLVHLADVTDADLELLARSGCQVAYCPRSAAYFDSPAKLGPHRFLEMLDLGINVCLGTDSVVNIPADELELRGLSVLDEARLLMRTRRVRAQGAISMCTVNGAKALGLASAGFTFEPGPLAGLVAADPTDLLPQEAGHLPAPRPDELLLLGEVSLDR